MQAVADAAELRRMAQRNPQSMRPRLDEIISRMQASQLKAEAAQLRDAALFILCSRSESFDRAVNAAGVPAALECRRVLEESPGGSEDIWLPEEAYERGVAPHLSALHPLLSLESVEKMLAVP